MLKTIALLTAVTAMTGAGPAFAQFAPSTDLAKAEAGEFTLDRSHGRIIFAYNHLGYSTSYGLFTDFAGKLHFEPQDPTKSRVEVTINTNGIDTTVPRLDEMLKSATYFDVATYPTASFKSTKLTVTGPTTGTMTGDLTVHGVTKPVTLDVTFNGGAPHPASKVFTIGFNATGQVKRSEFGLGRSVPLVGDDVILTISAEFDRTP
jgi:polyisoprenoid-binding protein YceI